MSSDDQSETRARIEGEIAALEANIRTLEESTKPVAPDVSLGRLTRMEQIQSKSVNEAALANARKKLGDLKHTLERIGTSDYGLCAICGNAIAPARLEYMPETKVCVTCA